MLTRKIAFIRSPPHDPVRSHMAHLTAYAAGLLQWGFAPIFLDAESDRFPSDLRKCLYDPEVKAFVTLQGFGSHLRMQHPETSERISVYHYFRKPVVSVIGDYPFYPWVNQAVSDDHPYRVFFCIEPNMIEQVRRTWPDRQAHYFTFDWAAQDVRYDRASAQRPSANRNLGLLYVGSYLDPENIRQKVWDQGADLGRLLDVAIERSVWDFDTPIWHHGTEVLAQAGRRWDLADETACSWLWRLNQFVRNYRRETFLNRLQHVPVTFICNNRPNFAMHRDSVDLGPRPQPDTVRFFTFSQAVTMMPPNFPGAISERFINAASRGAVPISTRTRRMREVFSPGEDYLEIDDDLSNLGDIAAWALANPAELASMRPHCLAKVDRHFRPADVASYMLACLHEAGFSLGASDAF